MPWLLLAAAVADWAGLRAGAWSHPPALLALLAGAAAAGLAVRLAVAGSRLARGPRRLSGGVEAAIAGGLLVALLAGLVNWLLSVQGFVVLHEGEAVPLAGGGHLQEIATGPLARIGEMDLVLALDEVELVPSGGGSFVPRSRLRIERAGEAPRAVAIDPGTRGADGSLRFYQGAFGFAPRIVLTRDGETLFDRVVPFTTEHRGGRGVVFEGNFRVEREGLAARGWVDLDSLDEGMRGHATLELELSQGARLLGKGRLRPGHFAQVADGYGVGFAGLSKWSEIDVARRSYPGVMLGAGVLALSGAMLGLVAWPLRRRRRG